MSLSAKKLNDEQIIQHAYLSGGKVSWASCVAGLNKFLESLLQQVESSLPRQQTLTTTLQN